MWLNYRLNLILAQSLLLPWRSCWSSRKQDTSPLQLPSRSVSYTDNAIIPFRSVIQHTQPSYRLFVFCFSPAFHGFLRVLRCSRRCGGHQARQPCRSPKSRTWGLLVTPHSCTSSARRWWTRIQMRSGLTMSRVITSETSQKHVQKSFCVPLCRFTRSEAGTKKFWTSWWVWFRKRPKEELIQFWWGRFYRRRPREDRTVVWDATASVWQ